MGKTTTNTWCGRGANRETLRGAAAYRSKGRLPVLSWVDATTGAAIVRCAQPLAGLLGAASELDERLFEMLALSNRHCASAIHIVDARPFNNAVRDSPPSASVI